MPDDAGKLGEGANAHASGGAGAASTGIVRCMGRRAVDREMTAAEEAGIRIVAGQMGLVLTPRRLLVVTPNAGGRLRLQCQAKPARAFAEAFDRAKAAG